MKYRKPMMLLSIFIALAGLTPVTAQFRGHEWGASTEEVVAIEGRPKMSPMPVLTGSSVRSLIYELEVGNWLSAEATFNFTSDDELYEGTYNFDPLFSEDGTDLNVTKYESVNSTLTQIYGLPTPERSVESLRARYDYEARRVRDAIKNGEASLYSEWWLDDLIIRHRISFGDMTSWHYITYKSRTLFSPRDTGRQEGL